MLSPLAIFSHLPEDTVAKPGCSKTWVTFAEDFLDWVLSKVSISRQGGILPGPLRLDSPSKKGKQGKIGHLNRSFFFYLGVPRWEETLRERGRPFLPCSCHCHLWLRSWRIFRYFGCSHTTEMTFDQSVFTFLFALRPRYLVLLYQLKACNLKITL
jgi:hypothetical protein